VHQRKRQGCKVSIGGIEEVALYDFEDDRLGPREEGGRMAKKLIVALMSAPSRTSS
jgi:hypothetical protein